ncbi:hypothetical protein V7152_04745 [Neobacillus drentensis]|uniref:hypothetical protein n=1 Tax=Neobacillus drentensis TaxID=220684 RepID=UPI0030000B3B
MKKRLNFSSKWLIARNPSKMAQNSLKIAQNLVKMAQNTMKSAQNHPKSAQNQKFIKKPLRQMPKKGHIHP